MIGAKMSKGSGGGGRPGRSGGGGSPADAGQPGEVMGEANKANAVPNKQDIRNAMKATDTLYAKALDKYGWANAQSKMPEAERQTYHKAVNDLRKQKKELAGALKLAKE
jgi:hypothetical protein